jgi:hypothetical protein
MQLVALQIRVEKVTPQRVRRKSDMAVDTRPRARYNLSWQFGGSVRVPVILIYKYQFQVSDPYSSGCTISSREALVLNSARADYIRNSAAKWLEEEERKYPNSILPPEALVALQQRISALDARFEFAPRKSRRDSALTMALREVALEQITARHNGKLLPQSQIAEQVQALMCDPAVQLEARRKLEVREQLMRESLDKIWGP